MGAPLLAADLAMPVPWRTLSLTCKMQGVGVSFSFRWEAVYRVIPDERTLIEKTIIELVLMLVLNT